MNKKFKLIAPSLAVIFVCLMLIVGSTFAIFTSKAEADISVTSGKVDVKASLSIVSAYSVEASDTVLTTDTDYAGTATAFGVESYYKYKLATYVNNNEWAFATQGRAALDSNGALILTGMVPGDKVVFNLVATNNSNVDVKYRFSISPKSGSDEGLLSLLQVKYQDSTYTNLQNYKSNWEFWAKPATESEAKNIQLEIILPVETGDGEDYANHNKNVAFNIALDAVQANAKTVNEEITSNISDSKAVNTAGSTALADSDNLAQVTIPQGAVTGATENTTISMNVKATDKTEGLTLTSDQGSKSFDVSFVSTTNNVETEVHTFTSPVTVQLYVGKGLSNVKVYHGTTLIDSSYDDESGIVTFSSNTFSKYNVIYEIANKAYGFANSYTVPANGNDPEAEGYVPAHWVHEIKTIGQFENILVHIKNTSEYSTNQIAIYNEASLEVGHLADEYTEYNLMVSTINLNGLWLSKSSSLLDTSFTGNLNGLSGKTTIQNIRNEQYGLFLNISSCSLNNIIFDDCILDGEKQQVSLFGVNIMSHSTVSCNNVIINENCSLTGQKNVAGLVSLGAYSSFSFKNCINNATITATSDSGAAGLAGNVNNSTKLEFINCANNGHITANNYAGGLFRYGKNPTFKNCQSNGIVEIKVVSEGGFGVFYGQSSGTVSYEDCSVGSNFKLYLRGSVYTNALTGTNLAPELAYSLDSEELPFDSTTTKKSFIASHAVKKTAPTQISFIGLYDDNASAAEKAENLTKTTLSLDLSGLSQEQKNSITSYKLIVKVESWTVLYDINASLQGQSGKTITTVINGSVTDLENFKVARLLYVGNTYPTGKAQPKSNWIVDHGGSYDYDFDWFLVNPASQPLGYQLLSDGSAYFIHNNVNVTGGTYYVTAKLPVGVVYGITFYDANGNEIAVCDYAADLWINSSTALKRISEIPSNVSVVE